MKYFYFLLAGIFFGVLLIKSEVASWFRIQEMFRFQSFHMYGIIGSAVLTGALSIWFIRKLNIKTFQKDNVVIKEKPLNRVSNFAGGLIFGLGWALTGACPGPLYALIGNGHLIIVVVLLSAISGTFVYGLLSEKLPH